VGVGVWGQRGRHEAEGGEGGGGKESRLRVSGGRTDDGELVGGEVGVAAGGAVDGPQGQAGGEEDRPARVHVRRHHRLPLRGTHNPL